MEEEEGGKEEEEEKRGGGGKDQARFFMWICEQISMTSMHQYRI